MRIVLYALLAVVCLALGAIAFVLVIGPGDQVRDQAAALVKQRTGRDLTIAGGTSFTLYPRLGIALTDVSLSEPPGMQPDGAAEPMLRVERLDVAVRPWPLLRREVEVDTLVLRAPVLNLRVDDRGRRNWEDRAAVGSPDRRAAAGSSVDVATLDGAFLLAAAAAGRQPGRSRALDALSLEDVRIIGGTVRYLDPRPGTSLEVVGIDARLSLAAAGGPLSFKGQGTWRGERMEAEGNVGSVAALGAAERTSVAVKLSSRAGQSTLEGQMQLGPAPAFEGGLSLTSPEPRLLLALAGGASAGASPAPVGPLGLTTRLALTAGEVRLGDVALSLAGSELRGDLVLAAGPARPTVRGSLRSDRLDVGPLLGLAAAQGAGRGGPSGTALPAPPAPAAAGSAAKGGERTIEDLIRETAGVPAGGGRQPTVKGWSSVPLDLSALRLADLDLKLALGRVSHGTLSIDRVRSDVIVSAGAARIVLHDVALYQGAGTGEARLNTAGAFPLVAVTLALDGVELGALLKGLGQEPRISGRGKLTAKLDGQGLNSQQIAESLSGNAQVALANGAVLGAGVDRMIRELAAGRIPDLAPRPGDRTEFSELAASFAIERGIARTQDLRAVSPLMRLNGTGTVDIAREQLDLTVRAKPTEAPAAGGQLLAALDVPVRVQGPWDAPRLSADLAGVLKDPGSVQKGVEQIGEALKGKSPKEIENAIRGLLGGARR